MMTRWSPDCCVFTSIPTLCRHCPLCVNRCKNSYNKRRTTIEHQWICVSRNNRTYTTLNQNVIFNVYLIYRTTNNCDDCLHTGNYHTFTHPTTLSSQTCIFRIFNIPSSPPSYFSSNHVTLLQYVVVRRKQGERERENVKREIRNR